MRADFNFRQARLANRAARGVGLVELMVSVAIGLVLTIILTSMIARQEGSRRTLTSGNDLTSNGAYVSYILDRELRSAGSGFVEGWGSTFGCQLTAARDGAQILPRTAPFPEPFNNVPQAQVLAPALIHAGRGNGGSDVIAVMAGSAGVGEGALPVMAGSPAAGQLRLANTLGFRGGDLVLLANSVECMLQQVAPAFVGGNTQGIQFAGNYAADNIASVSLPLIDSANKTVAVAIGNVAGNTPRFQLLGINANNSLVSYDLLRLNGLDVVQPLVDGVVELRALYGIGNAPTAANPGQINSWVAPSGAFDIATLTANNAAANQALAQIVAIRVGVILRGDLVEKQAINSPTVTLFSDIPGREFTFNVPPGQDRQRYRALEFTVPLRNVKSIYP